MSNGVLQLKPSVSVELCTSGQVMEKTQYHVASVVSASPRTGVLTYAETFGSDVGYGTVVPPDIWRFRRSDRMLAILRLDYSAFPEEDHRRVQRWLSAESRPGSLRLIEPLGQFYVAQADNFSAGDRYLMMLRGQSEEDGAERLRVEVSPGLHLLFADGLLAGWMLDDPEYRFFCESGVPSPYPRDPELARIQADYLNLLADPAIDRILDKDPEFRRGAEDLAARIDLRTGAIDRRKYLYDSVREFIDGL